VKELIELCEARARAAHVPHAVATVLRVEGSSYRRPGARMLVDVHGRVAGSVSGGCLERAVITEAQAAIHNGRSRVLTFDTTDQDDLTFGTSLGCQGRIWIGIEPLAAKQPWPLAEAIARVRTSRRPEILITHLPAPDAAVRFEVESFPGEPTSDLDSPWRSELETVRQNRRTRFAENDGREALLEWLAPPLALILLGGGPDVPPLVRLAVDLGHEVTVIDRRPEFARPESFPGAHRVIAAQPHQIAAQFRPDARTVAVVMNHHYETDRDGLAALLPLGLPYLAVLGPRRRTDRILAELAGSGIELSDAARASLHAPAGLDLGTETPEQIALAILAEIQATLAGRTGGSLRHRDGPIHPDSPGANQTACASA
jgi:xanthine/CO dehydrogenase XdhC/CoxF family maturation factor